MIRSAPFFIVLFVLVPCAPAQETEPFLLDDVLKWEGRRHNTLGPTGRRLFADRIKEAPGFRGVFGYLHAVPDFKDPVIVAFRDEKGGLGARQVKTIWRPSHLETRWVLGRSEKGGVLVIEKKFITDDDALVDLVRVVNQGTRPVSFEAVVRGAVTPLPERYRSHQIHVDLSAAANIPFCPGRRLFTNREPQPFVWTEGEDHLFQHGSAGRDRKKAASSGECLGSGFGGRKGDRALYLVVCPDRDVLCICVRYARASRGTARFRVDVDGETVGSVEFSSTGGWGGAPSHWKRARIFPGSLEPGLRKISFEAEEEGSNVNIDGFFVMPRSALPPPLPERGRYPSGAEEQIPCLPGSIDYDGVRYSVPGQAGAEAPAAAGRSPAAEREPEIVALRGGIDGDPAFSFPETVFIDMPDPNQGIAAYHLLALVAGPRGFGEGSAAAFSFLFDDGSEETVPFPSVSDRIGTKETPRDIPPVTGPAAQRADWRFLVLPNVSDPSVRLSYTPPPGRFVRAIRFSKKPSPGIPILLAATMEIPPKTGRLPVRLGQKNFHSVPVSLALAGTEFVPVRTAGGRRALLRSFQIEPGGAESFSLVLATGRRDDEAARAAIEKADEPQPLRRHIARYRSWFDELAPCFECSDPVMEKVWSYRVFLMRHCMMRPGIPPMTAPVFYEGLHGNELPAIMARSTSHIMAEVRWLRHIRFARSQLRVHLRSQSADGLFPSVRVDWTGSHDINWIPAAALGVYRVHKDEQYLKEVLPLIARNADGTFARFDRDSGSFPRSKRVGPDFAAFLFASCRAVAEGHAILGNREKESEYLLKAEKVKRTVLDHLWDEEKGFYPFAFGLVPMSEPWFRAFERFVDPGELRVWNRPVRPHANSLVVEAAGAALRSGARTAVTEEFFEEFLGDFARLHLEGGRISRPLIRECYAGDTGEGIGCVDHFRSTYIDLIIRFVGGLVPRSGETLALHPVVKGLDHFRLARIPYHGRDIEIVWVRPGTESPWPERGRGYSIFVDGKEAARRPELGRMAVKLPDVKKSKKETAGE